MFQKVGTLLKHTGATRGQRRALLLWVPVTSNKHLVLFNDFCILTNCWLTESTSRPHLSRDKLGSMDPVFRRQSTSDWLSVLWHTTHTLANQQQFMISSTLHIIVIASRLSYVVINRRWPSFSSCCGSCMEQSTAACHIRAVTASLPQQWRI